MRQSCTLRRLAAAAAAAAMAVLAAGPALADPPGGVTPKPGDVVGAGSDTTQFAADQLAADHNKDLLGFIGPAPVRIPTTGTSGEILAFWMARRGTPPYTWVLSPGATSVPGLRSQGAGANNETFELIRTGDIAAGSYNFTLTLSDSSNPRQSIDLAFQVVVKAKAREPGEMDTGLRPMVTLTAPALYSWDAVPQGQMITPKAGCNQIVRPTGSSAGISALETSQTISGGTGFCIDYARSSRGRATSDPPCATGGICFVSLAGDAVTWAYDNQVASYAPASLTLKQLQNIYLCNTTNWDQVGGANVAINPLLPQTSSGTRAFFLLALGGGTTSLVPGSCVGDSGNTLIENEGVAPDFGSGVIFPYSVADFLAQGYHSAACTNGTNCGYPNAPACAPSGKENLFGCNLTDVLTLGEIQGTKPTSPWPLPAQPVPPAINGTIHISSTFDALFQRTVYDVVRYDGTTADHIPAYLEPLFAASTAATPGWICTNAKAQTDLKNYGFLNISSRCGSVS